MAMEQQMLAAAQSIAQAINNLAVVTNAARSGLPAPVVTVSQLPAAATYSGYVYLATDSTSTTRLAIVAGGGANVVLVYSNGTNWLIL